MPFAELKCFILNVFAFLHYEESQTTRLSFTNSITCSTQFPYTVLHVCKQTEYEWKTITDLKQSIAGYPKQTNTSVV